MSTSTETRSDRVKDKRSAATVSADKKSVAHKHKSNDTAATVGTTGGGKREIYYTPEDALQLIEPFIRNYKSIWDPACGPSENYPLKDFFEKQGHRVICSDVLMGKEYDFFLHKTKKRFDIIVTTPPYSLRKEFILRALDMKKPFALLVPVNILESQSIRDALKIHDISLIYPPKTINFIASQDSRSVRSLPYSVWVIGRVPNIPHTEKSFTQSLK